MNAQIIEDILNQAKVDKNGRIMNKGRLNDMLHSEHLKAVKNCRIANVSVSLLEEAAKLVGNPGTNISGSCDVACMEWQDKYKRWRNDR